MTQKTQNKTVIRNVGLMLSGALENPILDSDCVIAIDGKILDIRSQEISPSFSKKIRLNASLFIYSARSRLWFPESVIHYIQVIQTLIERQAVHCVFNGLIFTVVPLHDPG